MVATARSFALLAPVALSVVGDPPNLGSINYLELTRQDESSAGNVTSARIKSRGCAVSYHSGFTTDPRFFTTNDGAFFWPRGLNARSVWDVRGAND